MSKKPYSKKPYIDSLIKYSKDSIIPFHCPGHKGGAAYERKFKDLVKKHLFTIETNEIPPIDTFQNPQGPLKQSQELMAKAFGVYKAFYVLGGSTLSNHIAIISSVSEGDNILIPRNSHKSVFSAVILSGATPIFLYPSYNYKFNIDNNIDFYQIKKGLEENSISAVVFNHPTYYGLVSNLKSIADYLDSKKVLFIVDQAWGAHFKFHPSFPICSTDTKAHIIVISPHKTLTSFTQSSLLLINHSLLNSFPDLLPKIHQTTLMLNSTSPSSLLFLSLDYTQYILNNKRKIFDKVYSLCLYTINELKKIDEDIVFNNDDISKIVVNLSKYGLSGYELEEILLNKYKIQVELSDLFNIIILITVGDNVNKVKYFVKAIRDIVGELKIGLIKPKSLVRKINEYPDWTELAITPRKAYTAKWKSVNLKDSVGQISSQIVTTYPPGIPILIPGEKITKQIVSYIEKEIEYGSKITGLYNIKERKISVVDM